MNGQIYTVSLINVMKHEIKTKHNMMTPEQEDKDMSTHRLRDFLPQTRPGPPAALSGALSDL